jgi:hypothetical protein
MVPTRRFFPARLAPHVYVSILLFLFTSNSRNQFPKSLYVLVECIS